MSLNNYRDRNSIAIFIRKIEKVAKGKKTGGRQKGTPNKVTGTVREMISKSISKELESLPELLGQLEPKEKIDSIIKLMPYIVPRADENTEKQNKKVVGRSEVIEAFVNHMRESAGRKSK